MLIEGGFCECGCGQRTAIAKRNQPGYRKGDPIRYLRGHGNEPRPDRWVERDCGFKTPCWVWQLALSDDGYGIEGVKGRRSTLAHRNAYEDAHGPLSSDVEVDHLCRNRACVNPGHLEAVTSVVNVRRGIRAKINAAQASMIRARVAAGETRAAVARDFGLGWSTVDHIVKGRTWRAEPS